MGKELKKAKELAMQISRGRILQAELKLRTKTEARTHRSEEQQKRPRWLEEMNNGKMKRDKVREITGARSCGAF